jgi:hypothetical protein
MIMIKTLQKFFDEVTHENIRLWCDAVDAIDLYDTFEKCDAVGEEGYTRIETQTATARDSLHSIKIDEPAIVAGTVKQSVDELVLTRQTQVWDALQAAASTANEETKVANLTQINGTDSLFDAIRSNVQVDAIPMIFAVFSRKNDYYGLGSHGTDTTTGGSGR